MNDPAGSAPGPRHDDPGTGTPSATENPDAHDLLHDVHDGRDPETDDAEPPQAGPPSRLPEGYEPL